MTEKVVLILDGLATGKTLFIDTIKDHGWWTWNLNPNNLLGLLAPKLEWDGNRDKNYYEFIESFKALANKHFDFEIKRIDRMIEKFLDHEIARVLILHNTNQKISEKLTGEDSVHADKTFTVLITDNNVIDDTYCKTLNYRSETYVEDVLHMMDTLTKSFGKENE